MSMCGSGVACRLICQTFISRADALELLGAFFHCHELARCFDPFGPGRLAHDCSLSLCPLLLICSRLSSPISALHLGGTVWELVNVAKGSAPERIGRLRLESRFCCVEFL
jgi:hypothetical protein